MAGETTTIEAAAQQVIELEEELEASGQATLDEVRLVGLREILHGWIEGVRGVVISPAVGRVTVIDAQGRRTSIGSCELAYALSAAGAPSRI